MSEKEHKEELQEKSVSTKRRLLNWLTGISIISFIIGLVVPLKDLALAVKPEAKGKQEPELPGQRLVFAHEYQQQSEGHTHSKGTVVTADKLNAPSAALVAPEDLATQNKYLILLHKLKKEDIKPPTKKEMTDQGFVAYSAICTHLGCTVDWTEQPHNVGSPRDHCPCHIGEFDPYEGAKVVGGPPPRPLPQIGVRVNDNNEIVLTSKFESKIGSE
ncbi:MAG: ubiquinol-cytochrome c reductase iron-sulfur subunit [Halobacteriaceae archaeon]